MPKGSYGQTRPANVIGSALHIGRVADGEDEDTVLTKPRLRVSGSAGPLGRQAAATEEERRAIARNAAQLRWPEKR